MKGITHVKEVKKRTKINNGNKDDGDTHNDDNTIL